MGRKKKFCGEEYRCTVTGCPGADLHRVLSRGAGGSDAECNLMPLQHRLHVEVEMIGLVRFAQKYPEARFWLLNNGWEFSAQLMTWFPPKDARLPLKKVFYRG